MCEKYAPLINAGVRKHKLSDDECATAYFDSVLAVFDHVSTGRFEGKAELGTYLYQLFSNKCVDAIRKKTTNRSSVHNAFSLDDSLLQLPDADRTISQQLIAKSDIDRLHEYLRELGEKCRAMVLAWGEGYGDDEIAVQMGYASAAVAKTSRLLCIDKLRDRYQNRLRTTWKQSRTTSTACCRPTNVPASKLNRPIVRP